MAPLLQIILGSTLLAYCAVLHVGAVAFSIPLFRKLTVRMPAGHRSPVKVVVFLLFSVFVLLAAHTVQIWTWAGVFVALGGFTDIETSFYFATVTYTTLGYGDVVLGPDLRIVATFCAITGLLTFGISTAFLIGVLTRTMPDVFGDETS